MSFATITAGTEGILVPGTDFGARLTVRFVPQTENQTVTKAADGYTNVGAITAVVGIDGQFEDDPQIPLGLDQGTVVWQVEATAIDRIPGLPKGWTYGQYTITSSAAFSALVDVDVTTITPEDRVNIGQAATTAAEKAIEAQGWSEAAASEAADAAADADLAEAARVEAEEFATGFTAGTVTPLAPGADPTAEVVGPVGAKQLNLGIPGAVADDASMAAQVGAGGAFDSALSATFASGYTVPMPTGGDDTALINAALTGTRLVVFPANQTYQYAGGPNSLPAFSGMISGNGSTIEFGFLGPYSADAICQDWNTVYVHDLGFTGAPLVGGIFGGNCAELAFRQCRVFDLTTAFSNGIERDLSVSASRFYQSATPPAGLNQTVQGANAGRFVVEDCEFNFAPTGAAGALVGTIVNTLALGASVHISRNRFLTDDQPGYSIDAAIDIEPVGLTPYSLVEITGNVIYNASVYATGGDRINVHGNTYHYTSHMDPTVSRMMPVIVYNSESPQPATGVVDIADNEVVMDAVAGAWQAQFWKVSVPVTEIRSRNNRVVLNTATTDPRSVWELANTAERVVIDGDVVVNGSSTTFASVVALRLSLLPSKALELRRSRINGKFFAVVGSQSGSAQTCSLLAVADNDFSDMTVNGGAAPAAGTYIYNDSFGTFTKTLRANNAALDY